MSDQVVYSSLSELSKDERSWAETIYRFAKEKIEPLVSKMDEESKLDPSIISQLFELGCMGVEIPVDFDGSEASFMLATLTVESLARVDPSVAVLVDVQNTLVNNALIRWCNDEQKARILPKMATEWVGSYALSEASSGSDAFALKCKAQRVDGGWLLNGNKLWITNGGESQLFIVMANTDFEKGYKGITSFLVQRGVEGFTVGKKEEKLGIRASSTTELIFEDCFIADVDVLGEVGRGYKIAIETLNEGRIGIGAQMVGLAQGAFDYAMSYMLERQQFGKPIAHFQGLAFQYAQVATEIEAARLMVYNAARLKDTGQSFVKEAAMAKLFSSQVAERAASLCVEFVGGVGFTREYPLEKFYRDAKIGKIYEGTSNMQLNTIAKLLRSEYSQ